MKRNHDRSPDKKAFSVALPKSLIEELGRIADNEHRSRNGQIEAFLAESVKAWKREDREKSGNTGPRRSRIKGFRNVE